MMIINLLHNQKTAFKNYTLVITAIKFSKKKKSSIVLVVSFILTALTVISLK